MSINRNDLFFAIERCNTKYKIADLDKKMRKKSLHTHKTIEKIIKEIIKENPLTIIRHNDNLRIRLDQLISTEEIMKSIKENLLTGKFERIDVQKVMNFTRPKLAYKPLDLGDKTTVLTLVKHPDIPKPDNVRRKHLIQCFGCDWKSPLSSAYIKDQKHFQQRKKRFLAEVEQVLCDHYRNEV